jgi:short-subunit dehydrogenase
VRFDDASVLVTGASSGIGEALALELAGRGARLTLAARREARLLRLAEEVGRIGAPLPRVVVGDLTAAGEAERAARAAISAWGMLDALVNNAGVSAYGEEESFDLDEYRRIMEVNYFAPVRLTLAALPHFLARRRGLVVNVTSVAAIYGVPYLGAYGASKAALTNFSQALRAELRGTGVRVMVIYPNYTDTELFLREAVTGTARRPRIRHASAARVAAAVVRAAETNRRELVLTLTGKAMQRARGLAPGLLDRVLAGMATRLREPRATDRRRTS